MKKRFLFLLLIVFLLIGCFLIINNRSSYYSKRLINSIENSDIGNIKEIIAKHPTSVNSLPSNMPRWWHVLLEKQNFYPIQVACLKGNIEIVELLLESGAEVNCVDPDIGSTPLIMTLSSTSKDRFNIAFLLIEDGADIYPTRKSYQKISVLSESIIIRNSDPDVTKEKGYQLFDYLIENIKNENIDWVSILLESSYFGNINAVDKIINSLSININSVNSFGQTPLIKSVLGNSKEMVSYLINNGANKNMKDNEGMTALDYAIKNKFDEILVLLEN